MSEFVKWQEGLASKQWHLGKRHTRQDSDHYWYSTFSIESGNNSENCGMTIFIRNKRCKELTSIQ